MANETFHCYLSALDNAAHAIEGQVRGTQNKGLIRIVTGAQQIDSAGTIAAAIGNPRACRAVGLANGRNPIAIVVPCHRILRTDGSLGGYAYGLPVKAALLAHEGALLV